MSKMTCTAAGDAMIFRRLPGDYPGFEALRAFLGKGDFRFLNLETTVHNFPEPSVFGVPTVGAESLKRVYDNP